MTSETLSSLISLGVPGGRRILPVPGSAARAEELHLLGLYAGTFHIEAWTANFGATAFATAPPMRFYGWPA